MSRSRRGVPGPGGSRVPCPPAVPRVVYGSTSRDRWAAPLRAAARREPPEGPGRDQTS